MEVFGFAILKRMHVTLPYYYAYMRNHGLNTPTGSILNPSDSIKENQMKPEERITEPKYQCPMCRRWKLEAEYGPGKSNPARAGANAYCHACNDSYNMLFRSKTFGQGDNTGDRRQIGPPDHRLLFTDFLNAFRPLGLAVRQDGSQPAFEFKGVSAADFFAVAAHLHEEGIVLVWE